MTHFRYTWATESLRWRAAISLGKLCPSAIPHPPATDTDLQTDITSILKVMDQASGALDEVERRTDQLNAKLDALLAEGEETRKRVEERKAEDAKAKANGETSATDTTSEKSSTKDSDSKEGEESSKSEKEGESGSDKSEKEEAVIGTAEGSA